MCHSEQIVDYFYVCGVDYAIGLESFSLGDKRDGYLDLPPMKRPYKCRVLQHFPEYSPNYPFDEESTALVTMPQGLNVFSQSSPLFQRFQLPQRHTFIITREDGTRVHGLTLLFSELVTHEGFKEAVNSLQMMYTTDFQSRKLSMPIKDEFNLEVMQQQFETESDSLFTTKAIGLLSRHPFIYGLFNWLEDLWAMMYIPPNTKCLQSAFEQCIHDILFQTKLPTVGHYVTFSTPFRAHHAYRPAPISSISNLMNGQLHQNYCVELSLFEYSIQDLFELIDLDDFIRLFTCTLLEYRIILFSKVYYRLMLIAECVTCLLLPFYWPHVYAPILPVSLTHFVDAPVPFIMGINISPDSCSNQNKEYPFMKQFDSDNRFQAYFYPSSIELASEANVCYVYIDEGRVIVPDEIPQFPNYQDIKQSLFDILKLAKHLSKNFNNQSTSDQNTVQRLTNISQQSASTSSAVTHTAPVLRPKPPSSLTNANGIQRGTSLSRSEQPQSLNGQGETTSTKVNGQQLHIGNSSTGTSANCCINENNQTTHFAICSKAAKQIISKEVYSGYTELLHINAAVRNLFLANFTIIFQDYENYLILDRNIQQNTNNLESISSGLEAFDKVGFLSDQPETHLPFLSAFLETQMFASFLDSRINWHNLINNLSRNNIINNGITSSPPMHLTVFHLLLSKSRHERKSMFRSNNSTMMNTSTVSSENISYDSFLGYHQQKSSRSIDSHFPAFNSKPVFESIHYQLNTNNDPLPDLLYDIKTQPTTNNKPPHYHLSSNSSSHTLAFVLPPSSSSSIVERFGKFPTLSNHMLRSNSSTSEMMLNVVESCLKHKATLPIDKHLSSSSIGNKNNDSQQSLQYGSFMSSSMNHHNASQSDKISRHILSPASIDKTPPSQSLINPTGSMSTPIKRVVPLSSIINNMNTTDALNTLQKSDTKNSDVCNGNNPKSSRYFVHTYHQLADLQRNGMAQANWDFVDALLEECKHRTKRMVLKKIGQEAIEMGHGDPNISVVEENTLVSGLCDLLERIWSHGLNKKL
ncbi:DENN domain-containing protein isoform 1, partial [Schistosoma japonicum]